MSYLPESAKRPTIRRRQFQGLLPTTDGGIDVGSGREKPLPREWCWWYYMGVTCRPWDIADGDAQLLEGVPDEQYSWLTASHILEHLPHPEEALRNWLRVVRPGGMLLVSVPHRDLYEQRTRLPSKRNTNHLRFYLPYESDNEDTVGLYCWLQSLENRLGFQLEQIVTGDWGYVNVPGGHPTGEYQIDVQLRKDF